MLMPGFASANRASWLAERTLLRPTSTGLPCNLGFSCCSTEAKNESSETCTNRGIGSCAATEGSADEGPVSARSLEKREVIQRGNTDSTQASIKAPGEERATVGFNG